jgi:hypothetical protein
VQDGIGSGGLFQFSPIWGQFELDPKTNKLRQRGQLLKLERIPTEVLLLLIEQRGQLVGRNQIVERVWGKEVFLDTTTASTPPFENFGKCLGTTRIIHGSSRR